MVVRKIKFSIAVVIMMVLIKLAVDFVVYNNKVMEHCDRAIGEAFSDVRSRALSDKLHVSDLKPDSRVALIHSPKGLGRGVCFLAVEGDYVKDAVYEFD